MRIPVLFALFMFSAITQAKDLLIIHDAMIPAAPPTMTVMGAFMTIENHSSKPVHITSITSSRFGSAELHRTILQGNVYKMQMQKELIIPARGKVELKHGGYHLMLFDPKSPLQAGEQIEIVLHLKGGKQQKVVAKVMAPAAADESESEHHQH